MPEFLINSSFEILMKYVFPLFNNIEILIHPVDSNYENSFQVYGKMVLGIVVGEKTTIFMSFMIYQSSFLTTETKDGDSLSQVRWMPFQNLKSVTKYL
jgi:hypothetical protein